MLQPPYSPDLALADFLLFLKLKTPLKGKRFVTIEEIKEKELLAAIPKTDISEVFRGLEKTLA